MNNSRKCQIQFVSSLSIFLSTAIRRFDYIFMVLTVIGLAQFIYLLISLVQSARM